MKTLMRGLFFLMLLSAPAIAEQPEMIGHVRTLQGNASIIRGGVALPAVVGAGVKQGDLIRTDKLGAVGIVLIDDTTISLGSGSELLLSQYNFDPKGGKFSLVMRMVKGTFSFLSGMIGKLAPDSVQLAIPEATIAVRGTKLLVEIKD
ncbi:FecR family protein [Formivibrio citricus]|uniref:FecR family protein n=1 Tax=Formivibrio citricus TaxID=83765 RepID=A0A1I4V139_9NEIS|nr:FecR domain-containing protein [Formivibrio citricus]SFM94861.1 FecR family protein [Formivibrio citricus]